MNQGEFENKYSTTVYAIEEAIEESDADLDFETVNNILTIICEDDSQIIITPQSANNELWLAAKSGGFHFRHDEATGKWVNTNTGEALADALSRIFAEQGNVDLDKLDI